MNARDLLHRVTKITGNSGSDPRVMIQITLLCSANCIYICKC